MNNEQRVQIGKITRKGMNLLCEFVKEELAVPFHVHFWQEFANEMKRRDLLQADSTEQPDFESMNTEQAMKFEQCTMPFGVNKDSKIKDISLSYLINITEPNDFTKKLLRYIRYRQRRT